MSRPDESAVDATGDRRQRKRQGIFYTPGPIANYMAASTLRLAHGPTTPRNPIRIVDPACGAGALLWAAYQWLAQQCSANDEQARFEIVRDQLFGVDLDSQALERLRHAFRTDLGCHIPAAQLEPVLAHNFRCGNAILGDAWSTSRTTPSPSGADVFHWHQAFPEVAAAGGFDVVLANPPYRRERGAKADLAELEHAPLSQRWRRARMDLWHYFFHRSLDLLQPNGFLSFIVNSYWTTSHAGQPLIERLSEETTPLEIVDLGPAPVFPGVGGRHLILQLQHGVTPDPCRILHLLEPAYSQVARPELWANLLSRSNASHEAIDHRELPLAITDTTGDAPAPNSFRYHRANRDDLFHAGRITLEPRPIVLARQQSRSNTSNWTLGDIFEVRQGIAENPPRVTRQQALERPEYRVGEGVFVLTAEELQQLDLSEAEQRCVRPYYSAAEIDRYWSPAASSQWLLYLTRETAADIACLPNIARHLSRFRPLLERRRETQQGKIAWWHLHWPREPRLFERPRILAVQMVKEPKFACVERPTYVGFAVNLILSKSPSSEEHPANQPTLPALSAILNSHPASEWFQSNAKHRGVNLDITGSILKNFPLPKMAPTTLQTLATLWHVRFELEQQAPNSETTTRIKQTESEINALAGN